MKPKSAAYVARLLRESGAVPRKRQPSELARLRAENEELRKQLAAAHAELDRAMSADRARMDLEQRVAQRRENGRGW